MNHLPWCPPFIRIKSSVSIKCRNSGLPFAQPYDNNSKFLATAVKHCDLREPGLGRRGMFLLTVIMGRNKYDNFVSNKTVKQSD